MIGSGFAYRAMYMNWLRVVYEAESEDAIRPSRNIQSQQSNDTAARCRKYALSQQR